MILGVQALVHLIKDVAHHLTNDKHKIPQVNHLVLLTFHLCDPQRSNLTAEIEWNILKKEKKEMNVLYFVSLFIQGELMVLDNFSVL